MDLEPLIRFYDEFSEASVERLPEFYASDAWFKDPFNEVRGVAAIQRIFTHMYSQVDTPRFVVTGQIAQADAGMLVWEFRFRGKRWGKGEEQRIRGVSHLQFDAAGKVAYHRDYWDATEELYEKLPLIGALFRRLRGLLATRPAAEG